VIDVAVAEDLVGELEREAIAGRVGASERDDQPQELDHRRDSKLVLRRWSCAEFDAGLTTSCGVAMHVEGEREVALETSMQRATVRMRRYGPAETGQPSLDHVSWAIRSVGSPLACASYE